METNLNAPQAELTPKQKRFVEEYLVDLNATQACIRAGYSEATAKQIGSENLSKPVLQHAIQELMAVRSKRTSITADYVLSKIHETVERCSQAEPVLEFNHETKAMEETGEYKFEHAGVLKGCELLGKHLKLFTEKLEIEGMLSIADELRKRRERAAAGRQPKELGDGRSEADA